MLVSPPLLDIRKLQEIMAQLTAQARKDLPEWKPAENGADAGTMLQLIFARLLELAVQRLNRVPEKNLLAFLDTMGVILLPPSPARVPVAFTLLPGAGPTRIPKGAEVGTQPVGRQVAISFETEHDITVVPALLAQCFTIDPTWDRYTDQTMFLDGQRTRGVTPFVGTDRIRHVLYLGDNVLLDFNRSVTVEVKTRQGALPKELQDFFQTMFWEYRAGGEDKTIAPSSLEALKFFISEKIDEEVIEGIGLAQAFPNRWLRAMLTTSFPDALEAHDLRLKDISLKVTADDLLPDFALSNGSQLDVTKDFLPFGEEPKVGDAFYIASQDAFSKPNAAVMLKLELKETTTPILSWEYWNPETHKWTQLPGSSVTDGTNALTQDGMISLWVPAPLSNFGDVLLRVRIASGQYRGFPSVTKFDLITKTTLSTAAKKGAIRIEVAFPFFAGGGAGLGALRPTGDLLFLGNEIVQVWGPGKTTISVTQLMEDHDKGESVELLTLQAATPIGQMRPAAKDTDTFELVITRPFTNATPPKAMDVLKIDDGERTEFVIVATALRTATAEFDEPVYTLKTKTKLLLDHADKVIIYRVTKSPDFLRFGDAELMNFQEGFIPFGKSPAVGDILYLGSSGGFSAGLAFGALDGSETGPIVQLALSPGSLTNATLGLGGIPGASASSSFVFISRPFMRINVDVKASIIPQEVDLKWEFLGGDGWEAFTPLGDNQDDKDTVRLRNEGSHRIVFSSNQQNAGADVRCVLSEISGKKSYWIRARIVNGNYGLPAEYVAVNSADPTKGFKVKPGTGNLNAPVLKSLKLHYDAERAPTLLTQNGFLYSDETQANGASGFTPLISVKELPEPYADSEPAFYLGIDAAFPEQPVRLYVEAAPRAFSGSVFKGGSVGPTQASERPRLHWEYFNGTAWIGLTVFDETNNLTESGAVEFLTPTDIHPLPKFDVTARYWIRARSSKNDPFNTQKLNGVFLNTVSAIQGNTVAGETLGSSNAQPGQTLRFARTPVLAGEQVMVGEPESPPDKERTAIEQEEGSNAIQVRTNAASQETETWVRWHEVANFLASDAHSRHYTLDRVAGTLTFGDGKHGLILLPGTNNIAATYRSGGGAAGNLPKGAVSQIKSALPGVAAVTNPTSSDGGAEAETVAMVEDRGPQTIRHRKHAVTAADFEWLAREADGTRVARAKCLPNVNRDLMFEPGWVTLLVVPQGVDSKLSPSSELVREIENYLEIRTAAGLSRQTPMRVNVIGPGYIQMAVRAEIVPKSIDETQAVKQRVLDALTTFFHPLRGGRRGSGWEFGRDAYASEISQAIEAVPGVDHLATLSLMPNITQHRFTLASEMTLPFDLPQGSKLATTKLQKAVTLAEEVAAGVRIGQLIVKGFKEGDRITRVLDLNNPRGNGKVIAVDEFNSDAAGFPLGSVVRSFDGKLSTRLAIGIPPVVGQLRSITVDDPDFASKLNQLKPGQPLTIFDPFPLTVSSIKSVDFPGPFGPLPAQQVEIAPYKPAFVFSRGSILATLDNHVRLPLLSDLPPGKEVTSISLLDFAAGDELRSFGPNGETSAGMIISKVGQVDDIVYLDDNFLVYSGVHRITMVED